MILLTLSNKNQDKNRRSVQFLLFTPIFICNQRDLIQIFLIIWFVQMLLNMSWCSVEYHFINDYIPLSLSLSRSQISTSFKQKSIRDRDSICHRYLKRTCSYWFLTIPMAPRTRYSTDGVSFQICSLQVVPLQIILACLNKTLNIGVDVELAQNSPDKRQGSLLVGLSCGAVRSIYLFSNW